MLVDQHGNPLVSEPEAYVGRLSQSLTMMTTLFGQAIRNPEYIPLETYREMFETDDTVKSAIRYISDFAAARIGEYKHESVRIAKWMNEKLRKHLRKLVRKILRAMVFGYSTVEICMAIDEEGDVVPVRFVLIRVEDTKYTIYKDGINIGEVKSALVRPRSNWHGKVIEIPATKLILYAWESDDDHPYGNSILKAAYKWWFIKDTLLKAWAQAMETYGSPFAWINTPMANQVIQYMGVEMKRGDYLLRMLQNLNNSSKMVIDDREDLTIFQTNRGVSQDFKTAQDHCDVRIYRAIGMPSLIMDNGAGVGSNALAEEHSDVFSLLEEGILEDVCWVLEEQLCTKLRALNFGEESAKKPGRWEVKPITETDPETWANVHSILTNAGYMSPMYQDDLDEVREYYGLPAATVEDLNPQPQILPDGTVLDPHTGLPMPGMNPHLDPPQDEKLGPDGKPLPKRPGQPVIRPLHPGLSGGSGAMQNKKPSREQGQKRPGPRVAAKKQGRPAGR